MEKVGTIIMNDQKKKKKSEITKEKLFHASVNMFKKKGYTATRTIDITNEIGVSHATFFVYFKTKEMVLIELFNRSDAKYMSFLNPKLTDDPVAQLKEFVSLMFQFITDNFDYEIASVMYSSQTALNNKTDFLISTERATYKIINQIVNHGLSTSVFKNYELKSLTNIIHRSIRGIVFDWILHKGDYNLVAIGNESINILLNGIVK